MLSFTQMRLIDRYFGGIVCCFFYALNSLVRLFRRPALANPLPLRKILVTKYFGIGSLILLSPMVRALRQRYPTARISLLTIDQNRAIGKFLPIFDDIITINVRSLLSVLVSAARGFWHIRRKKYDVVIDAEFFSRLSTVFSYLTGARYMVGFYLPEIWRGNFLTHRVPFNYYRHAILAFLTLAKSLEATSEDFSLAPVVVSDEVRQAVRAKLQQAGIQPGQSFICVNVNAGALSPERCWPKENFVELIKRILQEFSPVAVILIGAGSDAPLVNSVHAEFDPKEQRRVFNLVGRFDLAELCGLLELSQFLITNDSGPLHMAEALRMPTVSFFGPETPLLYGPVGAHHVVFYKGIYCSPCLNVHNLKKAPCNGNNLCMKLIGVDEVFASVKKLLEGRPVSSNFPVSFDMPVKELLTDYRSRNWQSSSEQLAVPITTPRQDV